MLSRGGAARVCGRLLKAYSSTMSARFQPEGWGTVIPRLLTSDVDGQVAFLRAVFGAIGETHPGKPAEIRIGDSMIMVSDGGGLRAPAAAFLYVYVPDADDTYRRALDAGARSVEEPADMPYGDRRATVTDPWGNTWQIATFKGR
jgi:PhnB protein